MDNFLFMVLNPPGDKTCPVDLKTVVLKDTPPSRELNAASWDADDHSGR